MRTLAITLVVALTLILAACPPLERTTYNTVVAAKAFLDKTKSQHPECPAASSALCSDLVKATAAKDTLIDAAEVYCSSPSFESGGACTPPAKGTPASDQAIAKLKAAIAHYNQTASDLKGAL